jgi:D-alanine-D-alanine ligase
MDKLLFKRLLASEGLPTPPFRELLDADDDALRDAVEALGLPLVVKPPALGSSVGVCIVEAAKDLPAAVRDARGADGRVLLEAFVRGRELTCPVLGEGRGARALPLIEIVPRKASWFDYKSKYEPEGADEICPAPVHPELRNRAEALALRVHRLIGARGVTRTDFMVDAGGTPLILEINTLPGMTAASLVPKAAAVAGLSIASLVRRLLDDAGESAPAETEAGA